MNQARNTLSGVLSALLVFCVAASGQVTTGTILGTVTDPTGAAVAAARVTITNLQQGTTATRETDALGNYLVPFLIPGVYRVEVTATGFRRVDRSNVSLQVDQRARVDVTLTVGDVTETIEVTAAAPLISQDSAEVGQVIEQKAVQELPLNGRNFAQLVYLVAGVTPGQAGENLSGASTFNPRAGSNFNPLGQRANANGWLIDGIDNNEYTFNTVIVQPTLESVREFKVLTGSYSAEFGRGAGVVSVSTRSGSNEFHGTAFWFHRNVEFDARNYFSNPDIKKPPFRRHQFGTAFSGPVKIPGVYDGKNRTFFFADYAGQREFRGLDYINSVPTAGARQGDFSTLANRQGQPIVIYNPYTTRVQGGQTVRDPFPSNTIPGGLINPVALNVASIFPMPNVAGLGNGHFDNFTSVANRVIEDNQWTTRIDHQFSERDTVFFRYAWQNYSLDAPQGQANCCLPTPAEAAQRFDLGPFVAGIQNTRLKTRGAAFNWTRTWKPNMVGEFRAGFSRTLPNTVQSDYGRMSAESLGIRNINVNDYATGLPTINIGGYTGISGGPSFLPANPRQTNYQIDYNTYWTVSRHNLKFGYHVVRRDMSPFTNQQTRGDLGFGVGRTANPATGAGGIGMATMLLGYPVSGSRGFLLNVPHLRAWEHALFLQDDFKVSRKLTLNLGLRYEAYLPEYELQDQYTNFDMRTLRFAYANEDGYDRRLKSIANKNFGPRFGLAYDVTGSGNTVIRAGYGLSYFPEPYSASSMLTQNPPHLMSQGFNFGDFPLDFSTHPQIGDPFGPATPIKPQTTEDINRLQPQVRGHSFDYKMQYTQSWSFNVQRQLGESWMAELGYTGSRGINLLQVVNYNEVRPGTGSVASRRPIQALSNIPSVPIFEPSNMSNYHAFTTRIQKSFAKGFQMLGVYTFGKSLDWAGSAASGGGASGGVQTNTCFRCSRGPSGFDVKHRAVINLLYDLPWGRGRAWNIDNRAVDFFIGGWQVGSIQTYTTGRPQTLGNQVSSIDGLGTWPDRIGDGRLGQDPFLWYDPSAFQRPAVNQYGNAGRGIIYSPGHANIDFSIVKTFPITEKARFQFRFEAFNMFNTPYFGFPNGTVGSPTAGRITSTVGDNRSLQFAGRISF